MNGDCTANMNGDLHGTANMNGDLQSASRPLLEKNYRDLSKKSGWSFPLVLAALSSFAGLCIPCGYSLGNINTPSFILKAWCNASIYDRYDIFLDGGKLDILWSTVVSIFLIGGMTGSLIGAWVADKLGRKGAVVVSGVLQSIAGVMYVSVKPISSVELLLVARIISGLGSGLATAVVPMFLMELAPPTLKGAMGVVCPLGVTLGVFLGQVMGLTFLLGTPESWHYLLSFYMVLVVASALALPWIPESPKYLYAIRGDRDRAIKVLSQIRKVPSEYCVGELEDNDTESNDENKETWSIMKLVTTKSMLLNLALTCALQAGQQLSGINAVFYYSVSIFMSAGLSESTAQYATLGAGGLNFVMGVIMMPVVNNFPRRLLSIISCSLSTIFLLGLTICMSLMHQLPVMSYISIVAVMGYILSYGFGLGPIPYFIGSELFDVGPRPAAMALGSVANWTGNFLVGMTFPTLQRAIGKFSFIIFAACTFLLTLFIMFCLPETNAKVLLKRREKEKTYSSNENGNVQNKW